jgi:hypothetical protein
MDVAAPPPTLALTGDRSPPFSHLCAEAGTRARIRCSAAGDIPMVPRQSPRRWRQSLQTGVVQARVVCTCAWKCSQLTCLHAGIASIKKWRRFR